MTATASRATRGQIRRAFLGGIAAHLLTIGIARFAYTPLLPVMQAEAGLGQQAAGLLGALIYAGYLSAVLLLSALRDPARRLAVFRACLVLAVASTAMMALSDRLWLWALSRYLGGFSGAGGMLLAAEFLLGWLRRSGARPDLGPHFTGLGLGICLSGLVTLGLGGHLGWAGQWSAFALLGAALLPLAWVLVPRPAPAAPAQAAGSGPAPRSRGATRWFALFGAGYLAAGWGYAAGATFAVDILAAAGHGGGTAASVWVILGLATAAGPVIASACARWSGLMPVLLAAMALQALSLAGFALPLGLAASFAAAMLFGASFMAIVATSLLLAGLKQPEAAGQAMARLTLLYGTGQMLAPPVTAFLAERSGGYALPILLAAGLSAAGLALMALAGGSSEGPVSPRQAPR
ncbi:YbfB/YjiJ family MFS transporter [Poseidonocella sp. HB161398]|uniref:YbfB/YjiJ family MFS transporter n=1 Tax=Poseidonocella sp. HB161398 TaxID=2320855 RepID=UPI001109289E|nr:YbfB/YjiJ family MFS transporter [Poseidonocella sp. HB161398]